MSSIDYKFYCPSYKRADVATSHRIFPKKKFCYVVRESEADEYFKNFKNTDLLVIPEGDVCNISTTRNWILDNLQTEYVVMVDDDYKKVGRFNQDRKLEAMSPEHIDEMTLNGFQMCIDADIKFWGLNNMVDPRAYSINIPFYFSCCVLGPWQAMLDTKMRYDEELTLKEDYDMTLQMLFHHRRVLRFNMYAYDVNHQTLKGGCQSMRTKEKEIEQNELLKKKWGDVIKENKWAKDSINLILRTGL